MNQFTKGMAMFKHSVETDDGFVVGYGGDKKSWRAWVYHSGYVVREVNVSCIEDARGLFDVWLDEFQNLERQGK